MFFSALKQFHQEYGLQSTVAGGLALLAAFGVGACAGFDADGDGFYVDPALCGLPLYDCDDSDREVGHGEVYYYDCDGDGFGDQDRRVYLCDAEKCGEDGLVCDTVSNALDCNDFQSNNDDAGQPLYMDCDGDGLGDPTRYILYCEERDDSIPLEFNGCPLVLNGDDCLDNPNDINAASVDQPKKESYWFDCDGDGYGDDEIGPLTLCPGAEDVVISATNSANGTCSDLIQNDGDCDDRDGSVNPAAGNCGG